MDSITAYLWGSTSTTAASDSSTIEGTPSPIPYSADGQKFCRQDNGQVAATSATYISTTVVLLTAALGLFYAYISIVLQPRIRQLEQDDAERRMLLESAAALVNDSNKGGLPQSDGREAPEGTGLALYQAANVQEGSLNALVPLVREWRGNKVLNWQHPDQDGASPLIAAAGWGNTDAVWLLISQPGIEINLTNKKGRSAFAMACWNGSLEVVMILASLPATDINLADEEGTTPLVWAIENSRVDIVQWLISLPSLDVNKADKSGLSPIHCAAQQGHVEVMRLLLSHPLVIVNKVDGSALTALQYASMRGFVDIEDLLRPRAR